MSVAFEWDPAKAKSSLRKHGVGFDEAVTAFSDVLSMTISDPLHSENEDRFVIIGESLRKRLLVVVHADHGDKIRIISARRANAHERKAYEEGS